MLEAPWGATYITPPGTMPYARNLARELDRGDLVIEFQSFLTSARFRERPEYGWVVDQGVNLLARQEDALHDC